MIRILVVALAALLLLAPPAQAVGKPLPEPDYPDHVLALLPSYVNDSTALVGAGDRERAWWPDAEEWLTNATNASAAGRFRVAVFDLETFTEVLLTKQLMDEAAALPNDAERKTFVIQRTTAWKQDADRAWTSFRETLHAYDGQIRSLRTLETALYGADMALTSAATVAQHAALAREFPAQPGFDEGYVMTLVRYSHTPLLKIQWSEEMLQAAADVEGTGARIKEPEWANLSAIALGVNGTGVQSIQDLRTLGQPARDNGEATLALAFALAEQRSARLADIQLIYGDAQTRFDTLDQAARNMNNRLENLTLDTPRGVGLDGVFTSDAADRARYALEFHERRQSNLGLVLATWASMDHADYVSAALAQVSPITPPEPEEERGAPLAPWLALAGIAVVAVALRRPRRG